MNSSAPGIITPSWISTPSMSVSQLSTGSRSFTLHSSPDAPRRARCRTTNGARARPKGPGGTAAPHYPARPAALRDGPPNTRRRIPITVLIQGAAAQEDWSAGTRVASRRVARRGSSLTVFRAGYR